MKTFHLMAVVVLCFAAIRSTWGLSCPCWDDPPQCIELTEENCPYGVTSDACGCCPECVNGPGDECGGPFMVFGPCSDGYECVPNPEFPRSDIEEICQRMNRPTENHTDRRG